MIDRYAAKPDSRGRGTVTFLTADRIVVAACLLPLVGFTLAWGPAWLLDYLSQDNWSYVKFFLDWASPDPVLRAAMAVDYKGSRVAWIAPGFVAYHLRGPFFGSLALNLMVAIATRHEVETRQRPFFIILSTPELAPALDRELVEWASSAQVYIRPRPARRETFTSGAVSLTVQVYGAGQRARRFTPSDDE